MPHAAAEFVGGENFGGAARWSLNLAVGLAISGGIFFALSQVRTVKIEKPAAMPDLVQTVRLSDPPPPPPVDHPTAPAGGSALNFPIAIKGASLLEPSPSESVIRIRATSPSMGPTVRPEIQPEIKFDPGLFRPTLELAETDANHVFSASDVDEPATPKFQPSPKVSRRLFDEVKDPRVTVLMLVNAQGTVEKVWLLRSSGNAEFDSRMTEGVQDWEFHPGRRKGKAVRQWVQQGFIVRIGGGSRFGY